MLSTIYKTAVASGSISAGAALIDSTTANAFIGGVDVSAYRNGNYQIHLYQAATGKLAWGWISATAPGGETVSELVTGDSSTFTGGVGNWVSERSGTIAASGGKGIFEPKTDSASGAKILGVVSIGALCTGSLKHRLSSGTAQVLEIRGPALVGGRFFTPTGTEATFSIPYLTAGSTVFAITNSVAPNGAVYEIDDVSFQRVTSPAATGALLLSTKAGSRGFAKNTGIDPNAAMTYKIYGEFKANGNAGYVR
jgi:hypothetical protein